MNQNFPKYGICAGTQQIMYIFIIEQIQSKLMTKFFSKFKKPVFGQFFFHFPNFWGKKIFLENPDLPHTTSYGFLTPCQNLEKTNYAIPRKHPNRQKDGWKDGQTLFHRTLLATAKN